MSPVAVRDLLLSHVGLKPDDTLPAAMLTAMASRINAAIAEIIDRRKELFMARVGVEFAAPVAVTLSGIDGRQYTSCAPSGADVPGRTVILSDGRRNRFLGGRTLLYEYVGDGTVSTGTVYGDACDVETVLGAEYGALSGHLLHCAVGDLWVEGVGNVQSVSEDEIEGLASCNATGSGGDYGERPRVSGVRVSPVGDAMLCSISFSQVNESLPNLITVSGAGVAGVDGEYVRIYDGPVDQFRKPGTNMFIYQDGLGWVIAQINDLLVGNNYYYRADNAESPVGLTFRAHENAAGSVSPMPQVWGAVVGSRRVLRVRLWPAPGVATAASFDVVLRPPELKASDMSSTSLTWFTLFDGMMDDIVLPVVERKWSSAPWFANAELRKTITEEYRLAIERLERYEAQHGARRVLVSPSLRYAPWSGMP